MLNNNIQSLPNEVWKPVENFESIYWVSNKGRVKNNRKVLKPYLINSGYFCIDFTVNGKKTKNLVHRLVAIHFVDNPKSFPEVNHIDEDKQNNYFENLQWCTSSLNKQHSIATGTYDKIYTAKNTLGKKHLPSPASKYHNVTYDKARGKWVGCVRDQGKNLESKRFDSETEAALHVNYLLDKYNLTNRPKNVIEMPND